MTTARTQLEPLEPYGDCTPLLADALIPDHHFAIRLALTEIAERPALLSSRMEESEIVPGFEDILGEQLGIHFFQNTQGGVYQLTLALAIASHAAISATVRGERSTEPRKAVELLRKEQVLSGLRILDLGCGRLPGFALAAKALGGVVYTADAQDLKPDIKSKLNGHVVVDLNDKGAPATIIHATGGNFDLVTENIIGELPFAAVEARMPKPNTIRNIGVALLKRGGYGWFLTTLGMNGMLLRRA